MVEYSMKLISEIMFFSSKIQISVALLYYTILSVFGFRSVS